MAEKKDLEIGTYTGEMSYDQPNGYGELFYNGDGMQKIRFFFLIFAKF